MPFLNNRFKINHTIVKFLQYLLENDQQHALVVINQEFLATAIGKKTLTKMQLSKSINKKSMFSWLKIKVMLVVFFDYQAGVYTT